MSAMRKLLAVNILVGITLLVSLANNIAIAGFFGLTREVDAYFAAGVIPGLFMALFVDYLGKNFLPVYSNVVASKGDTDALVSSVVTLVGVASALAAVVFWAGGPELFRLILPGFDPQDSVLVARMFAVLAPTIVIAAVNTFHEYVWQHDGRYSALTACKMLSPIAILVFVVAGREPMGIWCLPAGYLAGDVAMCVVLWSGARYRYRPRLVWDEHLHRIFVNSGILVGSGLITRLAPLVERVFASTLPAGSIAALSLGQRLTKPMYRSALMGVRMMQFSRSSRLNAKGEFERVGALCQRSIRLVLLVVVPLVVWIGLSRADLVQILFQRGRFDADMTRIVSLVLLGAVPAVAFRCCNQLMSQTFYVIDRIKEVAVLGPVSTGLALGLMALLVGPYGVLGIAVSGSFRFGFSFFVMLFLLNRTFSRFSALDVLRDLSVYVVVAASGTLLGRWMVEALGGGAIPKLAASGMVEIGVYVGVLWLARNAALGELFALLRGMRRAPAGHA